MNYNLGIFPPWDQRLAGRLVPYLARTRLSPNAVTTISLAFGLGAGALFALGDGWVGWGAVCFALAFFIDHIDGALARATGRTSAFGHYYDIVAGGVILVAVFVGIGVGQSAGILGSWALCLGAVAGFAVALIFSVRLDLERSAGADATEQPNFLGFEIEDVMYLLLPIAWFGALVPFLVLASIGAPAFLIWQIVESRRHRLRRSSS